MNSDYTKNEKFGATERTTPSLKEGFASPLGIISLFVFFTEAVLTAGVTQTSGDIQVWLTIFVGAFPVLVFVVFSIFLWHKPVNLYSPRDYSTPVSPRDFVAALTAGPNSEVVKTVHALEIASETTSSEDIENEYLDKIASIDRETSTANMKTVDASEASVQPGDLDVPRFDFFREIPSTNSLYSKGVQFTDKDPENPFDSPRLYLSVYFKDSRYFAGYPLLTNEKWLYLEANMRHALNLRIQVRAFTKRDVDELMNFLHNRRDGWNLQGPRPADDQAGDYFYVWRENDENRLMISTYTPSNAGISIHARFSSEVAKAFANYLEDVGFTMPFKE